jgi:hypothetical protein
MSTMIEPLCHPRKFAPVEFCRYCCAAVVISLQHHPTLSEWISYEALGLAHGSHAGEAVAFFFY